MNMRPFHRNSIIEALCEVRFEPTEPWDIGVFASFYEAIKDEYTERPRHQVVYPPSGPADEASTPPEPNISVAFRSADGKRVIQLTDNLLTVNLVGSGAYTSWLDFRDFILKMTERVLSSARPTSITGISLRYVNRFDQSTQDFEPAKYYKVHPHVPKALRPDWGPYVLHIQLPVPAPEQLMLFNVAFLEEDKVASILDINSAVIDTVPADVGTLTEVLERGHERVEMTFVESITDTARQWLNGEDV